MLHIFSSSTGFPESGKSYSPFAVLAILEHDSDFSAAARTLEPSVPLIRTTPKPEAEPAPAPVDDWPVPPDEAAFRGILADITRAVEPHTEADPVAILGTLMALYGTVCGGARTFYQGSQQRANLSILLVGETGSGRKGTSLGIGRSVFRSVYPTSEDLWLPGLASGEGLVGHLRRSIEEAEKHGGSAEYRALVLATEFAELLTIMGRQGSTLSAVLRNAWDGVPLGVARAREGAIVTRHHVSLLGHITPVELRAKLTDTDAANGFANRILFLAVRRPRLVPFPESPDGVIQRFGQDLHAAILAGQRPGEMRFDAEAREKWEWFYAEQAMTARLGLAGAVTARYEAQVARLALLYAMADSADAIGGEHLGAAIALADYGRRSAAWALGESTGNRHADVLLRMLEDGPIAWSDAKSALGLRTAADMAETVAVLTDAGVAELATETRDGGGRPRRVIRAKGAKGAKAHRAARSQEAQTAA